MIRFVTGLPGSGKSHTIRTLLTDALSRGGYEIVDKFARKEIFIEGALTLTVRKLISENDCARDPACQPASGAGTRGPDRTAVQSAHVSHQLPARSSAPARHSSGSATASPR